MGSRFIARPLAVLAGVLLVGTLTTLPAQAATRDWGPLDVSIPRGDRQAEASGTAGWRDGQPYVWARFRDYNGTGDNDLTFVQAAFYKYESWVCGPNGFRCYGYRLQDTKRTAAMTYDTKWHTNVVRLGHQAIGSWRVRARICDQDQLTKHLQCSPWTRYMRVH